MTLEQEKMRDLTNEIGGLKQRREKIKELVLMHRSAEMTDTQKTEYDTLQRTKELELDNEILKREAELTKLAQNQTQIKERKINMTEKTVNDKMLVRTAFAKLVRNGQHDKLSGEELGAYQRAINVVSAPDSVTTTSTTFTEATADVIGINNGGVFIPETVLLDILKEDTLASPVLNDVVATAIRGLVKFPYKVQATAARNKAEGEKTISKNAGWAILSGKTGNLTDSIVITFEAMAMTIQEFEPYLIELIREAVRDLLIADYLYGTGDDDKGVGIMQGATGDYKQIAGVTTGTIQAKLEGSIKLLPAKKRQGAKIYLSTKLMDEFTFMKNSNGDYVYPTTIFGLNGTQFRFPVVEEPNLADNDFFIGNVGRWYKVNINKAAELGVDITNKLRIREYCIHMMVTTAPVPNSFVVGKGA